MLTISQRILYEILQMIKAISRWIHLHHNDAQRVIRLKSYKKFIHIIQINQNMIFLKDISCRWVMNLTRKFV
jgi:hypothetical protein